MSKRYKAISPNREYNGKTFGVRFENGIAYFDELTVNPNMGLNSEQIASRMIDEFGYRVEVITQKEEKSEPVSRKTAQLQ